MAYREAGSGEPLVLIHGVGMQSAAWEPQIAALSETHNVIAIDMPGHGDTDPLPKGSDLRAYVSWFEDAMRALDIGRVNVAGHSMGALIAGGYVMTNPDAVRRVAVLNGVYRRSEVARRAVKLRAAEILAGESDIETPLTRWFSDSPTDQIVCKKVASWLGEVDLAAYGTAYAAFAEGDETYADGWPQVGCPVLALTGGDDPNSTPEMAIAMATAAQNGNVSVIQGHRHMVNLTAPDKVNAALRNWLSMPETERAKS